MTSVPGVSTLFETRLADDAASLWLLEDEAFVHAALTLLVEDRNALNESMHFVLLLREGYSKHFVLNEMAVRWRDAFRPGNLPGVRRRLERYRLACFPLIGGLFGRIFGLPNESGPARRLRVMENQLYLLARLVRDFSGDSKMPLAAWGGAHRVCLLRELLGVEMQLSLEEKDIYTGLFQTGGNSLSRDLEP